MISRGTLNEVSRNPDRGNAGLKYRFSNCGARTVAKHCLLIRGLNLKNLKYNKIVNN
jgi:hypothetical protein